MRALIVLSVLFTTTLLRPITTHSQCAGCTPNFLLCDTSSGPCPNYLDTATVGLVFEDTITFRLPKQVDASAQSGGVLGMVDFISFKINSISGLPFGINWSCDIGNCTYAPSSFPNGTSACVRFCGTALATPGNYNVVINTTGTVSTPFGNQSGIEIFNLVLTVLPANAGGNNFFSFSPPFGCTPLQVQFTNNNPPIPFTPTNYNTGINYLWDFGNGQTDTAAFPAPVDYTNPGAYVVNYQQVIDTLPFILQEVRVFAVNCTDVPLFGDHPDLYLKLFNGNNQVVYNTNNSTVTFPPSAQPHSWFPNIALTNQPYNIEIWDQDGGAYGADDNCFNNTENPFPFTLLTMPAANVYNVPTTFTFNQNGLNFNWTINKTAFINNASDTILVNQTPPAATMGVSPASVSCDRDSIRLEVPPGYAYVWFKDTTEITSNQQNFYYASSNGTYRVKIIDIASGCFAWSNDTTLLFNPAPPPGFPLVGITYDQYLLTTPLNNSYTFQWIYNDGTGWNNIAPPLGVLPYLNPTLNGQYALIAKNSFDCLDTSNVILVNNASILLSESPIWKLYPNPNFGNVYVRLPNNIHGPIHWELKDMAGRKMNFGESEIANETQEIFLNLNVPSGHYLLEFLFSNGIKHMPLIIHPH
jgi:hypothetical protein